MKYFLLYMVFLFACQSPQKRPSVLITLQTSGVMASLRGLAVVDENIAWASGSGGSVLRTVDGGTFWQNVSPTAADSLDFRDIEAFSATEALVLTAGYPGLVVKTTDGGQSWQVVYADDRPQIFFDAMDFWDTTSGIAFGDALDGRVVIITTHDGGNSWQQQQGPEALPGEGGYAASGTCITTGGNHRVWLAMGTPRSRILFSADRGKTWQAYPTPMAREVAGGGIFSLAFSDTGYGLAVGGNYTRPNDTTKVIALTKDAGKSWDLLPDSGLNGYKSAIAHIPGGENWLAAGPTGVGLSTDNGLTWTTVDTTGYHTVALANRHTGWLTGAQGKIAKLAVRY